METTIELILIVTAIQFLTFFVKGVAAFGDPLISNPLFSMMMDNRIISPMNLCLATPVNGYMAWKNRKSFSVKACLPMIACILAGVIPGTLLLKYATSWTLKAALGVLIIGIGGEMIARRKAEMKKPKPVVRAIVSFCLGVSAGLYGINLFFVAYVERTTENRQAF